MPWQINVNENIVESRLPTLEVFFKENIRSKLPNDQIKIAGELMDEFKKLYRVEVSKQIVKNILSGIEEEINAKHPEKDVLVLLMKEYNKAVIKVSGNKKESPRIIDIDVWSNALTNYYNDIEHKQRDGKISSITKKLGEINKIIEELLSAYSQFIIDAIEYNIKGLDKREVSLNRSKIEVWSNRSKIEELTRRFKGLVDSAERIKVDENNDNNNTNKQLNSYKEEIKAKWEDFTEIIKVYQNIDTSYENKSRNNKSRNYNEDYNPHNEDYNPRNNPNNKLRYDSAKNDYDYLQKTLDYYKQNFENIVKSVYFDKFGIYVLKLFPGNTEVNRNFTEVKRNFTEQFMKELTLNKEPLNINDSIVKRSCNLSGINAVLSKIEMRINKMKEKLKKIDLPKLDIDIIKSVEKRFEKTQTELDELRKAVNSKAQILIGTPEFKIEMVEILSKTLEFLLNTLNQNRYKLLVMKNRKLQTYLIQGRISEWDISDESKIRLNNSNIDSFIARFPTRIEDLDVDIPKDAIITRVNEEYNNTNIAILRNINAKITDAKTRIIDLQKNKFMERANLINQNKVRLLNLVIRELNIRIDDPHTFRITQDVGRREIGRMEDEIRTMQDRLYTGSSNGNISVKVYNEDIGIIDINQIVIESNEAFADRIRQLEQEIIQLRGRIEQQERERAERERAEREGPSRAEREQALQVLREQALQYDRERALLAERAFQAERERASRAREHAALQSVSFNTVFIAGKTHNKPQFADFLKIHPNMKNSKFQNLRPNVYESYRKALDVIHGINYRDEITKYMIKTNVGPIMGGGSTFNLQLNYKPEDVYEIFINNIILRPGAFFNTIPHVRIIGSRASDAGGVRRQITTELGEYLAEKFMFPIKIQEKGKDEVENSVSFNNGAAAASANNGAAAASANNGAAAASANNGAAAASANTGAAASANNGAAAASANTGAAAAASANTGAAAAASANNSSKNKTKKNNIACLVKKNNSLPQNIDIVKTLETAEFGHGNLIAKLLAYFSFVFTNAQNDLASNASLGITFSHFTLAILFNTFEIRYDKRLSTLFKDINDAINDDNIKYANNSNSEDATLRINIYKPGRVTKTTTNTNGAAAAAPATALKVSSKVALDKEIEKFIGFFYALEEEYDNESFNTLINQKVDDENPLINFPIDDIINLIIKYIFNPKELSELMDTASRRDETESRKLYIPKILERLLHLEAFSDEYREQYKHINPAELQCLVYDSVTKQKLDNNISLADLGECISAPEFIDMNEFMKIIKYPNIDRQTKSLFIRFLESFKDDQDKIKGFLFVTTGSRSFPRQFKINMTTRGDIIAGAHTCFNLVDIKQFTLTSLTEDQYIDQLKIALLLPESTKEKPLDFTHSGGGIIKRKNTKTLRKVSRKRKANTKKRKI